LGLGWHRVEESELKRELITKVESEREVNALSHQHRIVPHRGRCKSQRAASQQHEQPNQVHTYFYSDKIISECERGKKRNSETIDSQKELFSTAAGASIAAIKLPAREMRTRERVAVRIGVVSRQARLSAH
jgi:hypothetical protein